MKTLILLITIILASCSSTEKAVKNHDLTNSVFNPYYADWLVNGNGKNLVKDNDHKININFDSSLGDRNGVVGMCILRYEIQDREIFINEAIWNEYPEKRTYIIRTLLTNCYSLDSRSYPFSEFMINGL